jgi:hypothetical protein
VFDLTLNQMVTVTFIPPLGPSSRPFDRSQLPDELDNVADPEEARLEAVMFAARAVTPDAHLAGTHEQLPIPSWRKESRARPGVVFYVSPTEFATFAADLEALSRNVGELCPDTPVSSLQGHPAIEFVKQLLTDPAFGENDLHYLRDPAT